MTDGKDIEIDEILSAAKVVRSRVYELMMGVRFEGEELEWGKRSKSMALGRMMGS